MYVYDVLEMDYLGCPASSPLSSLSSSPMAFWEATPISSMRPQLHKSPKLLSVTFPSPQQLAQYETPAGTSDPLHTPGKADGVAAAPLHQNRKGYLQTEPPPRRNFSQVTWLTWCLRPILTLVFLAMGANKTSCLSQFG